MKAKPELQESWQQRPDATFRLIVRVSGDLAEAEGRLRAQGVQFLRRCRLINGLVIQCSGRQATALLQEPWVTHVELDEPVRAWACPDNA